MEVFVTHPTPIPTPPPRVTIRRYNHEDSWSLTFDEAELLHAQLGQVLRNNGRLVLG